MRTDSIITTTRRIAILCTLVIGAACSNGDSPVGPSNVSAAKKAPPAPEVATLAGRPGPQGNFISWKVIDQYGAPMFGAEFYADDVVVPWAMDVADNDINDLDKRAGFFRVAVPLYEGHPVVTTYSIIQLKAPFGFAMDQNYVNVKAGSAYDTFAGTFVNKSKWVISYP